MRRRSTGSFPSNGAEYTTNCKRSAPPRRERKHSLQFVPNTATRIAQRSPSRTSFTRTCDDLKGVSDESERSGGLGPGIFFPALPSPERPSDLATCQVVPLLASLISANKIECYHTCTAIRIRLHTRVPVPLRKAIRSPLILCAVNRSSAGRSRVELDFSASK